MSDEMPDSELLAACEEFESAQQQQQQTPTPAKVPRLTVPIVLLSQAGICSNMKGVIKFWS